MNTMNFNYQFNRACDEISSWRPVSTGKISHSSKLIRRIYYIFVNFDDRLKNIFRSKKNSYPKYKKFSLNSNHQLKLDVTLYREFWMDFYFEMIREINYRPISRDPWDNLQESTRKNKKVRDRKFQSDSRHTRLIRDSSRFTDSHVSHARGKITANTRFWERIWYYPIVYFIRYTKIIISSRNFVQLILNWSWK